MMATVIGYCKYILLGQLIGYLLLTLISFTFASLKEEKEAFWCWFKLFTMVSVISVPVLMVCVALSFLVVKWL